MNLKGKKLHFSVISVIILVLTLAFIRPDNRYFAIARNLEIFAALFKEVNTLYVDDINPNETIKIGIDAMLTSLDPYTNYIPEDAIEDFRTQSTGQYGGIGAITTRIGDKIKVIMVMEGYPAQKNGLMVGDEVIRINNIDVQGMGREETSELMKGQANTLVSLTVMRYGSEKPLTLHFKREKVTIDNVPYSGILNEDIGYIKLSQFTFQAGKEVRDAVKELKGRGAKKLILDLRGNPGGLLIEAVNITNTFILKGKEVVTTKGKATENNVTYKTLDNPEDINIPLAILINSGSASASEIVAGTIQDYDRGVIVGQKSFGKGLVQITRPLSYNAQLKVTTAKYYTPSGRCIQALDYSHRNADGSVGKVPDSLKMEFFTTNKRSVYDGGGIDPDISVEKEELSPIAYTLFEKGYIFDYADKYHFENPNIPSAKSFKLSDKGYDEFVQWLADKDYSYTTNVENALEDLTEYAHEEKYYNDIQPQITQLKATLARSKQNDLVDFKNQIRTILEEEIVSRYYFEKGSVESTFDSDNDILAAIKVLDNTKKYNQLLHRGI